MTTKEKFMYLKNNKVRKKTTTMINTRILSPLNQLTYFIPCNYDVRELIMAMTFRTSNGMLSCSRTSEFDILYS